MKYYTGINASDLKLPLIYPANYLFSYYNDPLLYEKIEPDKQLNILIDSGAFTLQRTGADRDKLKKYVEKYSNFIKSTSSDNRIQGYFEMDIDGHIGYKNVLKIRKKLEKYTHKIIPVWHHTLGIYEFKKMVDEYPYVSISCVKDKDIPEDQIKYFVKYAHNHKTKIHGLGMTRKRVLNKVPFDSVDSTSWKSCVRYGRYGNKCIKRDITSNKVTRNKLLYSALREDVLLQKHYEKYWGWYHY